MKPNPIINTLGAAFVLAAFAPTAHAQDNFYTTGTSTIDAAHSVVGNVIAGADSGFNTIDPLGNPYNPTVNVVAGGTITGNVTAFNSTHINISGGFIGGFIQSLHTSTILITGGVIGGQVHANNQSTFTISGGSFAKGTAPTFYDFSPGALILIGNDLAAINPRTITFGRGEKALDFDLTGTLLDGTSLDGSVIETSLTPAFILRNAPASVPEPGGIALFVGLASVGTALLRRRRRN